MGLLENARLFSRDDEWQKELQRSDEVILRHRSCSPYSYMSRQDAVHYAASRLIERIQTYGRLVLQLPGEYVKKKKIVGECTPYNGTSPRPSPRQEILRLKYTSQVTLII